MISPLLTDLYQLTMACGYFKLNMHEQEAVFHQIFRHNPFKGKYAVVCGLETVIDFLQNLQFSPTDLMYLKGLKLPNGDVLFPADFLDYLENMHFSCDVDAILEGNIAFPQEPLLRIKGPLLQGQLLESALLNIINFQTLIATKASRIYQVANGDPVLEFGLRRAQGPDGAISASRAAYIGGCAATSNVLAGKKFDIPVRGTHAHSWVSAFDDELTAFKAYATVMPHNCVLLVDTYDTIDGVKHAIEVGLTLRDQGVRLQGVRLDSGDMAALSVKARQLLDEAGFNDTQIIASNSLDEYAIAKMKKSNQAINVWGVGTNLVTSFDCPALDGVYKLSALRTHEGKWQYKLKLSEQAIKISNPGILQVRRYENETTQLRDVIFDTELGISSDDSGFHDLLTPIFRQGQCVLAKESIHTIRERSIAEVTRFLSVSRTEDYPVTLEKKYDNFKQQLIKNYDSRK